MTHLKMVPLALLLLAGCLGQQAETPAETARARQAAGTALVESGPGGSEAERLFAAKCGVCHATGKMYPGYGALKARGVPQPALAARTDIDKDYVKQVARNGMGSMPVFTPIQLSDAELETIATWLAAKRK